MADIALQGCSQNLGWESILLHMNWERPVLSSSRQDGILISNALLHQLDGWLSRNAGKCAMMASSHWFLTSQILGVVQEVGGKDPSS